MNARTLFKLYSLPLLIVFLGLCVYAGIVIFVKKQELFLAKNESVSIPSDHKVALSPKPLPIEQTPIIDSVPKPQEQSPTPPLPISPESEVKPEAPVIETPAVETKEEQKKYLYAKYRINVRQAPTSESRVVTRANAGEALEALDIQEQWSKVRNRLGVEGYVASYLLQEESGGNLYRVLPSSLNVRLKASAQSAVIGQLSHNTRVAVLNLSNDWAKIKLPNGQLGYISAQHIAKIN